MDSWAQTDAAAGDGGNESRLDDKYLTAVGAGADHATSLTGADVAKANEAEEEMLKLRGRVEMLQAELNGVNRKCEFLTRDSALAHDKVAIFQDEVLCNTLQHTATHCNTLQHTATHCNTLQYSAAHCSTLQHTAAHCSTLTTRSLLSKMRFSAAHCSTLQHTAAHCNTLQQTAAHCSTLQHTAARCNTQLHK